VPSSTQQIDPKAVTKPPKANAGSGASGGPVAPKADTGPAAGFSGTSNPKANARGTTTSYSEAADSH
jgi:hypothetical protein